MNFRWGMEQNLPGGAGIYYQKEDSKFTVTSLLHQSGWSMKSILWLEWLQETQYGKSKIRHALNGGEQSVLLENVRFKPDGLCEVDGVTHYLFFNGCRYHTCHCKTSQDSPHSKSTYERDFLLKSLCSRHGQYIGISECEFDILGVNMKENSVSCFFDKLMNKKMVSEEAIFKKIEQGKFYGLLCVDVHSPPEVVRRWSQLGWPTIPTHFTPTEEMIQPDIAAELRSRKIKIGENQLTLVFNQNEFLMTTDLYLFYHRIGMKMSNIKWAVEFTKAKPVKHFVETMTSHRKKAEREGNKALVELFKLIVNSSYGSFGLNVKKHMDHSYIHLKKGSERTEGPRIAASNHVLGEYSTGMGLEK